MSYLKSQGTSRKALVDTFTGTGTVGPFTLSRNPGTKSGIIVQVGAGLTGPDTYTLTGTSLTFSGAIEAGTKVYVYHLGVENAVDPNRTVTLREFTFIATEGQTSFSGADRDGKILAYRVGNLIVDVSGNTVQDTEDFDAVDGSEIIFKSGLTEGAEVHIFSFPALDIANVYTKDEVAAMVSRMVEEPIGTVRALLTKNIPAGWAGADGDVLLVSSYPDLVAECYVGDAENATADFFYRCTDSADPENTRSTTGAYIKLPNYNGMSGEEGTFLRGWNVDGGRPWATMQADQMQQITGSVGTMLQNNGSPATDAGALTKVDIGTYADGGSNARVGFRIDFDSADSPNARTGDETRPVNGPVIWCIKVAHVARVLLPEPEGVNKAGDLMEGSLRLAHDAVLADEAVTKRQLDASWNAAYFETGAILQNSPEIPLSNRPPFNNEGMEFATVTITPSKAGALLEVSVTAHIQPNAANRWCTAAIFKNTETSAFYTMTEFQQTSGGIALLHGSTFVTAPSTDPIVFRVRFGVDGTTSTLNGVGTPNFGGTTKSSLMAREIA